MKRRIINRVLRKKFDRFVESIEDEGVRTAVKAKNPERLNAAYLAEIIDRIF